MEIKPYVLDEQYCDECDGKRCENRYAPYFCGDVGCLQVSTEKNRISMKIERIFKIFSEHRIHYRIFSLFIFEFWIYAACSFYTRIQ